MKTEALKLADELQDYMTSLGWKTHQAPDMIRRLVEELEQTKQKYKSMHNLATQAMSRVHQLEKEHSQ